MIPQLVDILGTAVFAISGALAAKRKNFDLFGGVVLALVTAVGGGTFRDLVTGNLPVFWVRNPLPIYVSLAAALITFFLVRAGREINSHWLMVPDAIGLAFFCVAGTEAARLTGADPLISVMMGISSGVMGGAIRDILCGEVPLILRRDFYATAAFAGSACYLGLLKLGTNQLFAFCCGISLCLSLRLIAVRKNWSLPLYINGKQRS